MAFCHGKGDPDNDGCCHLPSGICHLRLKLVDVNVGGNVERHVFEGRDLVDRGTVAQFVATLTNNGAARNRATQQAQGITYACMAAIRAIVANTSTLSNRAALNAAWVADAQYQALVAPEWRAREDALGLPAGTLDCPTWRGTGVAQCCFAEDATTNEAKAATLSTAAVTIRRAGGN